MSDERRFSEAELHAYLDGELDAEARTVVEVWLSENPDDAARLSDWRRHQDGLADLHVDILTSPLPDAMRTTLSKRPPRRYRDHWARAAASVVLLVGGAIAGWWAHSETSPPTVSESGIVKNAVSAHVVFTKERRHAVEAWADKGKEEKHLVRWLSKRLGRPLNPPVLKDAGFLLVGGRLVADDGRPAAQFMYQDKSRNRLTLYVRSARDAKDTAFRIATARGVSAFYWIERPYAYALVGKVEREKLIALGEIVHEHLRSP